MSKCIILKYECVRKRKTNPDQRYHLITSVLATQSDICVSIKITHMNVQINSDLFRGEFSFPQITLRTSSLSCCTKPVLNQRPAIPLTRTAPPALLQRAIWPASARQHFPTTAARGRCSPSQNVHVPASYSGSFAYLTYLLKSNISPVLMMPQAHSYKRT